MINFVLVTCEFGRKCYLFPVTLCLFVYDLVFAFDSSVSVLILVGFFCKKKLERTITSLSSNKVYRKRKTAFLKLSELLSMGAAEV